MNDTENMQTVCEAKCSLNRVVTVHEIGRRECEYWDSHLESYPTPWHFVEYKNERRHHFLLHAIKEIGGFDLPVFEFKEERKRGIWGWLGCSTVEWKTVKEVSGGWIRLYNGERVLVSETYEELKELIEGGEKKE